MRPTLVAVTGPSASGKTTLAHALARAMPCPAICRDEIKEGLVFGREYSPGPGDAATRQATETFFEAVELLLRREITIVVEAAFQHFLWVPRLEAYATLADVRIIRCSADERARQVRAAQRATENAAHGRIHGLWPPGQPFDAVHVDLPTLDVDTTEGYRPAFEEIVAFARGKA